MTKLSTIRIGIDATEAKRGAAEATQALEKVKTTAKKTTKEVVDLDKAVDEVGTESKEVAKELGTFTKEVETTAGTTKEAVAGVDDLGDEMEELAPAAGGAAGVIGKLVGAITSMLVIYDVISTIREFEKGLVGVAKTTNLTALALSDLGEDILGMSVTMGVSTNELLEISQAAGQLGVEGASNILAFTDAVAKLGSASDLSGAEAATSLARMLNVTGEASSSVGALAAVIVKLGNSMAITESKIAHLATQVALSTAIFGTSASESAALGAAMGQMGIRAQLAGSAIGRTMRMIDDAVRNGGDEMKVLAEVTGKSADEIRHAFGDSATEGLVMFLEGLGDLDAAGGSSSAALAALGLEGEEILKVLPIMALRIDDVKEALSSASEEQKIATAHTLEFAAAQDTMAAQSTRLWNALDGVKLQFFGVRGALKGTASLLADTANLFSGLALSGRHSTGEVKAMAAAFAALAVPLAAIAIEAVVSGLIAMTSAMKASAAATWLLNTALMSNPLVAVATALAAVGAAVWAMTRDVADAVPVIDDLDKSMQALEQIIKRVSRAEATVKIGIETENERKTLGGINRAIAALEEFQVQLMVAGEGAQSMKAFDLNKLLPSVRETKKTGQSITTSIIAGLDREAFSTALSELVTKGIEMPEGARLSPEGFWTNISKGDFEEMKRAVEQNANAYGIAVMEAVDRAPVDINRMGEEREQVVEIRVAVKQDVDPLLQIELVQAALETLKAQALELGDAAPPTFGADTEGIEEAVSKLASYRSSLDNATAAINHSAEEEAMLAEVRKMSMIVDDAKVQGSDALKVALEAQIRTTANLRKELTQDQARTKLVEGVKAHIESLKELNNTVVDSSKDKKIEAELLSVTTALEAAKVKGVEAIISALREELEVKRDLAKADKADKARGTAIERINRQIASLAAMNDIMRDSSNDQELEAELLRATNDLRLAGVANVNQLVAALRVELQIKKELTDAEVALAAKTDARTAAIEAAVQQTKDARQSAADMVEAIEREIAMVGLTNEEREKSIALLGYEAAARAAAAEGVGLSVEAYGELIDKLQEEQRWQNLAEGMSSSFGNAFNDVLTGVATLDEAFDTLIADIGGKLMDDLITQPIVDSLTGTLSELLPSLFGEVAIDTTGATASVAILQTGTTQAGAMFVSAIATASADLIVAAAAAAKLIAAAAAAASLAGSASGGAKAKGAAFNVQGREVAFAKGGVIEPFAKGGVLEQVTPFAKGGVLEPFAKGGVLEPFAKGGVLEQVTPFAKGGVLEQVTPFAVGGVVNSPTLFPMAGNKTGLMGEAGPEAIMPLTRTPNGDLGVKMVGGGASTNVINNVTNINMTVKTQDANSFRQSKRQIMQDLNR